MDWRNLVDRLNAVPMWVDFTGDSGRRAEICDLISALSQEFQRVDSDQRTSIAGALNRPAKYLLAQYTKEKAVEARRTGSGSAVMEGLIPVVMAGGRSDNLTGALLLSILHRSAEKSGLNARELFSSAAQFAIDKDSEAQIRGFPLLPPEMLDIERFGMHERKTSEGVIYETLSEWMSRPRWWDKLVGRRRPRVTREELLKSLRETEESYNADKK